MPLGAAAATAAMNGADVSSADSSRKKIAMQLILPGEGSPCQPTKEKKKTIIAKSYIFGYTHARDSDSICVLILVLQK